MLKPVSISSLKDVKFEKTICEYRENSAVTKPILTKENTGSTFYEIDTRSLYMWDGDNSTWVFQWQM